MCYNLQVVQYCTLQKLYFQIFLIIKFFSSLFRMPFSKPMVLVDVLGGQCSVFIAHQALASLFINQRPPNY